MAFVKKTWKDRLVEFPGRRLLTRISGSADGQMVVDVARNEGNVPQAGDPFSAANMNDLEQRIGDEFDTLKGFEPILDSTGKIIGYKTDIGGADTVFPFSTGDSIYLGTNSPVDVSVIYSGYHNLTASDFVIGAKSSFASLQANSPASGNYYKTLNFNVSHSYNPETGILTFSGGNAGEYVDANRRLYVSGGIQNVFAVLIIPE